MDTPATPFPGLVDLLVKATRDTLAEFGGDDGDLTAALGDGDVRAMFCRLAVNFRNWTKPASAELAVEAGWRRIIISHAGACSDMRANRGTYGGVATLGNVFRYWLYQNPDGHAALAAAGLGLGDGRPRLDADAEREAGQAFGELVARLLGPAEASRLAPAHSGHDAELAAADFPRAELTARGDGHAELAAQPGQNGRRRFRMTTYAGNVVRRSFGPAVWDLSGIVIPKQRMQALREHVRDRVVGWTDAIGVSGGIDVEGTLSATTRDGREIADLMDEGCPFEASCYLPPTEVEQLRAGQTAVVNGRAIEGPCTIFRRSTLREVSFCSVAADPATKAALLGETTGATAASVRQWATDPKLRAEFGNDEAAFLAFHRNRDRIR